jgi:hypothetical protein
VAGFKAEVDRAAGQAPQAGPLAEATARQEVIVQETEVAKLEALREEQRLQTSVRRPAEANAYEQTTLAAAQRDAAILKAEAEARRVKLAAEADAERVQLEAGAGAERIARTGEAEAAATRARGETEAAAARARAWPRRRPSTPAPRRWPTTRTP